jgi:hypothetical protein
MCPLSLGWHGRVSEIGCPGHMPHSCGHVPATCQLSTGQLDILEHEPTKYTPNELLLLFIIKDLLVIFVKSSNPRIAEKISHSIAGI